METIQKLGLVALIQEIEKDLQEQEAQIFEGHNDWRDRVDPQVLEKCENRWRQERGGPPGPDASPKEILSYADLADSISLLNQNSSELTKDFGNYFKIITGALEHILPARNRLCHPRRPTRAEDARTIQNLVKILLEPKTVQYWPGLKAMHDQLKARPSVALGIKLSPENYSDEVPNNLPTPDSSNDSISFLGIIPPPIKSTLSNFFSLINSTIRGNIVL